MENSRLLKIAGYIVIGSYAVFNIMTLALMNRWFPHFGPEIAGPYSIMASKDIFIAFHVWGIIVSLVCIYSLWKNIRILFMISMFLLMIIMFYPYFTAGPGEKPTTEKKESIN